MRIQEPEKAIKVRPPPPQSCSLLRHTVHAWPHVTVAALLFSPFPHCSSSLLVKVVISRLIWCCVCIVICPLATPCSDLPCSHLDLPCLGLLCGPSNTRQGSNKLCKDLPDKTTRNSSSRASRLSSWCMPVARIQHPKSWPWCCMAFLFLSKTFHECRHSRVILVAIIQHLKSWPLCHMALLFLGKESA